MINRLPGYERIYLPLFKVADTPFHFQGDELYVTNIHLSNRIIGQIKPGHIIDYYDIIWHLIILHLSWHSPTCHHISMWPMWQWLHSAHVNVAVCRVHNRSHRNESRIHSTIIISEVAADTWKLDDCQPGVVAENHSEKIKWWRYRGGKSFWKDKMVALGQKTTPATSQPISQPASQ